MTEVTNLAPAGQPGITDNNSPVDPDSWWNQVDAYGQPVDDIVEGFDLVKDQALFQLVGVPLKMTKVVFRDGIQQKGLEYRNDFASIELRVAPKDVIAKSMPRILARRSGDLITDKNAIADPGEELVMNDGSTGVYRQIVQYLAAKQLIDLPEGPISGEKNECIYDLPRSQWLHGAEEASDGILIALRCPRGLRYSDYDSEYTAEGDRALTWYIA